jgi:putative transposase
MPPGTDRAAGARSAYVLMGNHYHLLLSTPEPNLVSGMTWFQGTYTSRYNARHRKSGHLFGGRYKAVLVDDDAGDYFRTVLDYIHLNPVRAGIVTARRSRDGIASPDLPEFQWSSLLHHSVAPSKRPAWIDAERAFSACELRDTPKGRREFVTRLEERARIEKAADCGLAEVDGSGLQSTLRRGWCFGTAAFKERLLSTATEVLEKRSANRGATYAGDEIREHNQRAAESILAAGLAAQGLEEADLADLPKGAEQKAMVAWKIRKGTTVPLAGIARRLHMGSASTVTRRALAMEREVTKSRRLRKLARAIDARKLT